MRVFLLAAFFAVPVLAHAQMLLVNPRAENPDLLQFNSEFIARNGVKSVNGQAWVKRKNQPMLPLDRYYIYRFGEEGRMAYSNNSFGKPGSGMDTASVMYSYDANGRLLQELHNDLNGYYALRNGYDAQGHLARVENVRIENLGTNRYHFVEGASTVISDEQFQYATLNDTTWRVTWLNDRGLPYSEQTFTKNKLGYLRQIDQRNLITQRLGRTMFDYDAKGRLAERNEQPDLGIQHWTSWKWAYDAAGNPQTRDVLHDGIMAQHSEYLYAEGTLFLKAVITNDNETGVIDIVRYEVSR